MHPARHLFVATFLAAFGSVAMAQEPAPAAPQGPAPQAPPMRLVLAGRTFIPPARGEAVVEFTTPTSRRQGDTVVTQIRVRNAMDSPIARLTIAETWYGKDDAVVTGGKGVISGLLAPGGVDTVVIETPFRPGMNANNFNFSHANGTVKPTRVQRIEDPPPAEAAGQ